VYIGGSSYDYIHSIVLDRNEIYFSGTTCSRDVNQSANRFYGGECDAFYGKVLKDCSVSWVYYFGGDGKDYSRRILLTKTHLFIVGSTQSRFLPKIVNHKFSLTDVFIAKVLKNGEFDQSFCYGGDDADWGYHAILDGERLFIAGLSWSSFLPGTVSSNTGKNDWFVAELTVDFQVIWSYLLGGSEKEKPPSITHDDENLYLTGATYAKSFPRSENINTGMLDVVVASITKTGELNWNCFIGGSDDDTSDSICIVSSDIYVLGSTDSSDLVKKSNSMNGCTKSDAFISRISNTSLTHKEAVLEIQPTIVDFGELDLNDVTTTHTFSITNSGNIAFVGYFEPDSSWIKIDEKEFVIPENTTKDFVVWVDTSNISPGLHNGLVKIRSDTDHIVKEVRIVLIISKDSSCYTIHVTERNIV
jgi:hypothetical protein